VNGVNISNENHRQVVARIKAVADETRLLVVDAAAEAHFKQRELVVRGDMPGVRHLSSNSDPAAAAADAPHKVFIFSKYTYLFLLNVVLRRALLSRPQTTNSKPGRQVLPRTHSRESLC